MKCLAGIALAFCMMVAVGCTTQQVANAADGPAVDQTFFNGKDLAGWTPTIPEYWSVKDGAIVGQTDKPVPRNEFIWSPVEVKDFYLALDVKLEPNECNAGIQFRSQKHPPFEALGYQADMGKGVWGRLYHESGHKKLFWLDRGENAVKVGEWNRYEILAVGDRIWTAINGTLAVAVRDPQGEKSGYIALQMHAGPAMTVQYKINKLVHNPKVELAGMDEKKLDAALVAPDVDDSKPARPATKPATKPSTKPTTKRAKAAAAGETPGEATAAASAKAQPAGVSKASAVVPVTAPTASKASGPAPIAAKSDPLADVPPQRRFADAPVPIATPVPGYTDGKFDIAPGETIIFAGQTNMVRQQQVGELEAQLAVAFADKKPRFRSMAWEGDTVYQQWRDLNFGGWQAQFDWAGATAVIAWFGQTEALDGKAKLDDFIAAYGKLIDEWSRRTKRIVLVSPMPFEKPAAVGMPDHSRKNSDLKSYAEAIRALATSRGLLFVDLYTPFADRKALSDLSDGRTDYPLTLNGLHLTETGQMVMGGTIATSLQDKQRSSAAMNATRQAIVEKNQLWFDNWRPMNWAFAYGDRQQVPYSKAIGEHPPLKIEYEEFKPLIKTADEKIHELAQSAK
ncbi:family 16 glycoside hydrolase [Humisphaera borealis]|uniref:DUF1080 domain-containing protein n=1 Tax=Humisphaera borealis TaxID=2807512 RepID=A0A7M2WVJ5_9BACT|nr:family 16 glycoside hydrolase [Humisphaera borealis]QOV88861.1 DUF1080 domain-containing protein [Humisphaera borealis]